MDNPLTRPLYLVIVCQMTAVGALIQHAHPFDNQHDAFVLKRRYTTSPNYSTAWSDIAIFKITPIGDSYLQKRIDAKIPTRGDQP